MPRLLVLNNYSIDRVWAEVRRGDKPAHHLYGVDLFSKLGFTVEVVPETENPLPLPAPIARAVRALPPMGDVRQQLGAIRRMQLGDVIYSPCQTQTHLLSYLRAVGALPVPLVALAHHPLSRSRWPWMVPALRLQLRGTDAFPSLSRQVASEIAELSGRRQLSEAVPWGPDLDYYPRPTGSPGIGAIAAGRTGRDFLTFARAASRALVPTSILCLRAEKLEGHPDVGPNIRLTAVASEGDLNYRTLVPLLAAARVHAIPLMPGRSLAGLTSLADAMALGKPVIMTRHPLIDVDLEGEGIGRWVDPGDAEGWEAALRWFEDNPAESANMGLRARALAERRFNAEAFAQAMASVFERVLA